MKGIDFWANIATILSIFFALYIFWNDKRKIRKNNKEIYINKLESLKFELKKNNDVILGYFDKDLDEWTLGKKIGYFRYSTSVTNKLIAEGSIQSKTLLRNLDAIADNFNQVNNMLNVLSLMAETSIVDSVEVYELFHHRILQTSHMIIKINDQIRIYLPKIIDDLEIEINKLNEG